MPEGFDFCCVRFSGAERALHAGLGWAVFCCELRDGESSGEANGGNGMRVMSNVRPAPGGCKGKRFKIFQVDPKETFRVAVSLVG